PTLFPALRRRLSPRRARPRPRALPSAEPRRGARSMAARHGRRPLPQRHRLLRAHRSRDRPHEPRRSPPRGRLPAAGRDGSGRRSRRPPPRATRGDAGVPPHGRAHAGTEPPAGAPRRLAHGDLRDVAARTASPHADAPARRHPFAGSRPRPAPARPCPLRSRRRGHGPPRPPRPPASVAVPQRGLRPAPAAAQPTRTPAPSPRRREPSPAAPAHQRPRPPRPRGGPARPRRTRRSPSRAATHATTTRRGPRRRGDAGRARSDVVEPRDGRRPNRAGRRYPVSIADDPWTPAERELLRARARNLAQSERRADHLPHERALLVVVSGEPCAIPASVVRGVSRLRHWAPLPGVRPEVAGLFAWNGQILPAFQLRTVLAIPLSTLPEGTSVVVVGTG